MMQTIALLARQGIESANIFWPGLQFVDSARNFIIGKFLEDYPNAEFLFFIDDDIGFPAQKALEFLSRPEDIVAGVYPMKTEGPEYAAFLCLEEDQQTLHQRNGLHRATLVPFGFMRVRRRVIEALARKSETYTLPGAGGSLQICINVVDRGNRDPVTGQKCGEFIGEDAWFCARAMHEGFEIWVDTDVEFDHRGVKRWNGNFRGHIAAVMNHMTATGQLGKTPTLAAPADIITAMPAPEPAPVAELVPEAAQ